MNTLFVRLEGPLQSWGVRARWADQRDTMLEPTKSGVVGLLACAQGLSRDQDDELRAMSQALRYGVRVDKPGRVIHDYQTVVGGVRAADGKIKINAASKEPETVVSHRYYLADASFLAALQGPQELIARLATALQDPVWPVFLGRRSCPSAVPPFAGVGHYASLEQALQDQPLAEGVTGTRFRVSLEVAPGAGIARRDNIESLRLRRYTPRYAAEQMIEIAVTRAAVREEE